MDRSKELTVSLEDLSAMQKEHGIDPPQVWITPHISISNSKINGWRSSGHATIIGLCQFPLRVTGYTGESWIEMNQQEECNHLFDIIVEHLTPHIDVSKIRLHQTYTKVVSEDGHD